MTRGDRFRENAAQAERLATKATDPEMQRQMMDLAQRWRELAREADEIEAATRRETGKAVVSERVHSER